MPSPGMRGWYVELDRKLIETFDELFPAIGSKALVTSQAIIAAIKHKISLTPEGEDVQRNGRGPESNDRRTPTGDDDGARPSVEA